MKQTLKLMKLSVIAAFSVAFVSGCSPEVGSKEWCNDLKEKPKGEWTANEAAEFTKSCLFK